MSLDAVGLVRGLGLFPAGAELSSVEIGDGNINYVHRVGDGTRSVIVKHADELMRGSATRRLTPDRAAVEAEVLRRYAELAPGVAPEVLAFDADAHAIVMEDLADAEMLRHVLGRWETVEGLGEQVAEFCFRTLVGTSDLVLDPAEKRRLTARFTNPEMCEITDRLVLTEPYLDRQGLNSWHPGVADVVEGTLAGDPELHRAVAALKEGFRNHAQALLHGDLHTGSLFVGPGGRVRVIDPEFACYGPAGYDLGNVVGNLVLALVGADVSDDVAAGFGDWVVGEVAALVDGFARRWREELPGLVADPLYAASPAHLDDVLAGILRDTAGYAGTEVIRRTVGVAKVVEVTRVTDPGRREALERSLLRLGTTLVLRADEMRDGAAYRALLAGRMGA